MAFSGDPYRRVRHPDGDFGGVQSSRRAETEEIYGDNFVQPKPFVQAAGSTGKGDGNWEDLNRQEQNKRRNGLATTST